MDSGYKKCDICEEWKPPQQIIEFDRQNICTDCEAAHWRDQEMIEDARR